MQSKAPVNISGFFFVIQLWLFPNFRFSLSLALSLPVRHCGWAETRPHVSAGSAASSAPIIASLPWHRAQRQLTARHLTAASHAWTPDTVTGRTKSAVSCWNLTQFEVRSVFINIRWMGQPSTPATLTHWAWGSSEPLLLSFHSRRMWVTFLFSVLFSLLFFCAKVKPRFCGLDCRNNKAVCSRVD